MKVLQDSRGGSDLATTNLDDLGETDKLPKLRITTNFSAFDGISDDKIEAMTLQESERHKDERMKLNG